MRRGDRYKIRMVQEQHPIWMRHGQRQVQYGNTLLEHQPKPIALSGRNQKSMLYSEDAGDGQSAARSWFMYGTMAMRASCRLEERFARGTPPTDVMDYHVHI